MSSLNQLEHWLVRPAMWLYGHAQQQGMNPIITSVRRTYAQQAQLYRNYLRGRSALPAAPPGYSFHEIGRAFDMQCEPYPSANAQLGAIWNRMGGVWSSTDPVHYEA